MAIRSEKDFRKGNLADIPLLASVLQITHFALRTTDWWTKSADSWTPRIMDALHRTEELSDDVLAAIEGTF